MRAPEFVGSVRCDADVAVVMLAGEVDLYSAPQVRALLDEAVATGAPSVAVDMALVSFCDATGLGVLVRANKGMRASGARLTVTAAPPKLRKLLVITGLTDLLQLAPTNSEGDLLAADLAAAAHLPLTRNVLDAALQLVVVMSQAVMTGADGVSITLPREGQLRTVAASNDVVLQMDHDQYDTGEGPCLDAATQGELFSSPALGQERRWPAFVPRARARGIESIMSTPLMAGSHPLGAINVYSRATEGFASHEQEWALEFASETSKVLMASNGLATAGSVDAEISAALESRHTIAMAQGVIMTHQRLTVEDSYRFLTDISRRTSRPLLEVCRELIKATGAGGSETSGEPG